MLNHDNKIFRNLQEQVLENMKNIANMKEGSAVLSEFGIKVVGEVDNLSELPSVEAYKTAHPEWDYGDAYAVGTEAPYTLYILTRANDDVIVDHWFDIGEFPAPGPQGEQGIQGEQGPRGIQGLKGDTGRPAGFGSITAEAETLPAGSDAVAHVSVSGPDTAKNLYFTFSIPRGADGDTATWGNIIGTLSNQTDLKNALDAKANASSLATVATTGDYDDLIDKPTIPSISANPSTTTATLTGLTIDGTSYEIAGKPETSDFTAGPGIVIDEDLTHDTVSIEVDQETIPFKVDLSAVAFSGDYDDLIDKPTIPAAQVNSDWNAVSGVAQILNKPNLATVATSGDYDDLLNKPTIPAAQVQSDYAQSNTSAVDYIKNKPDLSIYAQSANLATVATSGDYDDLLDKPDLSVYATTSDLTTGLSTKQNVLTAGQDIDITSNVIETVYGGSLSKISACQNTTMIWGTYGIYNEYRCKVSDGTVTADQVTADAEAFKAHSVAVGTSGTIPGYIYLSNDGVNWEYQISMTATATSTSWPNYTIYCEDLGITSGDFRIQTGNYMQEFLNSGLAGRIYHKDNYWNYCKFEFIEQEAKVAIDDDFISSNIARVSQIPTNYVTTDTAQTITATKSFSNSASSMPKIKFADNYQYSRNVLVSYNTNELETDFWPATSSDAPTIAITDSGHNSGLFFKPSRYNNGAYEDGYLWAEGNSNYEINLGMSGLGFKNLYLSGNLSDGTNSISIANIANKNDLTTVATTGDYNDLINKPTNLVTTDTEQTISGLKTIDADSNNVAKLRFKNFSSGTSYENYISISRGSNFLNSLFEVKTVQGGSSYYPIYTAAGGSTILASNVIEIKKDASARSYIAPYSTIGAHKADLGTSSNKFEDLYLSGNAEIDGNLSDGTNSISIANIANKTNNETWTITLADGTVVTKTIVLG